MEVVPTCTNAADYAHRVAEDARVRQIKELATRIQEDSVSSPDELLATLQREAEDIRGSSYGGYSVQPTPSTGSTIWWLRPGRGRTTLSRLAFPDLTRFWAAVLSGLACTFWGRVRQWANPPLP